CECCCEWTMGSGRSWGRFTDFCGRRTGCCSCWFMRNMDSTSIYPLSLHDALPIFEYSPPSQGSTNANVPNVPPTERKNSSIAARDRKSTRLNSSHVSISYAVFCLKKKNCCPTSEKTNVDWCCTAHQSKAAVSSLLR